MKINGFGDLRIHASPASAGAEPIPVFFCCAFGCVIRILTVFALAPLCVARLTLRLNPQGGLALPGGALLLLYPLVC